MNHGTTLKQVSIHVFGGPEGERRGHGQKKIVEEIKAKS